MHTEATTLCGTEFNAAKGPYQPVPFAFNESAYYFPEIGGIDIFVATSSLGLPARDVIGTFVPAAAAAVKTAITVSARNLWSPLSWD
jgi:hypothetical protein